MKVIRASDPMANTLFSQAVERLNEPPEHVTVFDDTVCGFFPATGCATTTRGAHQGGYPLSPGGDHGKASEHGRQRWPRVGSAASASASWTSAWKRCCRPRA